MRLRFTTRWLLMLFASFALLFTWYHYAARLTKERERLDYLRAKLSVAVITPLEYGQASERLLKIELSTPWVNEHAAHKRHRECVDHALAIHQHIDALMGVSSEDSKFYQVWQSELVSLKKMAAESYGR